MKLIISVVIVFAYDELHHQRNKLHFLLQNLFCLLIVLIFFLLYQVVHFVEVISYLLLEVSSSSFNFVSNCVLLADARNLRDVEVLWSHPFLFLENYLFRMLAFDASFHVPEKETITLLL